MRALQPEPHLFIIFGATGDLSRRKLLPAFYRLFARGALPERSLVLGVARDAELGDEGFRALAEEALQSAGVPAEASEHWCTERLFYQTIGEAEASDFAAIAERVAALEREYELPGNRAFYLALPPSVFPDTLHSLGEAGLNRSAGWTRLVVEKPFGHDLESARELNRLVHSCFEESQIYRIDHYLGKETVQNLLVFRFANPIFESLWNRDRIESVRILVAEADGIGRRAGYYEQAGALRDMVQNHLTQLLTLVAMEVPGAFNAEEIRHEKVKVLRAIPPISTEDVIFGQYTRGQMNGTEVAGYHEEPGVREDSTTPTYAALRLQVNNWRWQGVPFLLFTGKRMPQRLTRITVVFQRAPVSLFLPYASCSLHRNVLEFTLQPDEGFALSFEMKTPGQPLELATQRLDFDYAEEFEPLAEAYETLLLDVLIGDQTLFVHADEVEASWGLYTPLLEQEIPVSPYPAGSWGPGAAEGLKRPRFVEARSAS